MIILGIETSCDETGVAVYDSERGLLAQALHSQVELHDEYGGVVPELASRDHIRRLLPLVQEVMQRAALAPAALDGIAYTEGPGLAGALLVGAALGRAMAASLGIPAIGIHHLEGHLLSPLLSADAPVFPYVALLVSGGHTQLMRVDGIGDYTLMGETADDAAGEAFDKTAKLLGLPYPGGPALARLAQSGRRDRFRLPRPMMDSGDLDFSFSGLKTAVSLLVREHPQADEATRADIAAGFQEAVVDVLAAKSVSAVRESGITRLVIAGGVGANQRLRERLREAAARRRFRLHYPELEYCTDNGAMIALAGALRLHASSAAGERPADGFTVRPRWDLGSLKPPGAIA